MKFSKESIWHWAYSSFSNNAARGVVAEFIVGTALNALPEKRIEWDAYDLKTESGIKIEVKCSGYVQDWEQRKLSRISFDIEKKKSWFSEGNTYSPEKTRPSDYYCFCIHEEKSRELLDPLDTEQWSFILIKTSKLNEIFKDQKTVSLTSLTNNGFQKLTYEELGNKPDASLRETL